MPSAAGRHRAASERRHRRQKNRRSPAWSAGFFWHGRSGARAGSTEIESEIEAWSHDGRRIDDGRRHIGVARRIVVARHVVSARCEEVVAMEELVAPELLMAKTLMREAIVA